MSPHSQLRKFHAGRADRRYWVEVDGNTALALDGRGLLIRFLDEGRPTHASFTQSFEPEQWEAAISLALADAGRSPHAGSTPTCETSAVECEGEVGRSQLPVTAQKLVELTVGRVIDALRASDPSVPSDVELRSTDQPVPGCACSTRRAPEPSAEENGVVDRKPVLNRTDEGGDSRVVVPDGCVSVDHEPGHNSSPPVGAPSGAGLNNHEPTDGDPKPAGDPLQSPAGHSPRFPFARQYEYTPSDESEGIESSPAVAGAGKGDFPVHPVAGVSAVRPGEVPPITSPGQHGKQFLVEPDARAGLFNVDCGACGEGRTLDPNSLALYFSIHVCGQPLRFDTRPY